MPERDPPGIGQWLAQRDERIRRLEVELANFASRPKVIPIGGGFTWEEGGGSRLGTATLVAGTATVANGSVTADSRIFLTAQVNGVTGALRVSARSVGVSFTITSSNGADAGLVAWMIMEPAT